MTLSDICPSKRARHQTGEKQKSRSSRRTVDFDIYFSVAEGCGAPGPLVSFDPDLSHPLWFEETEAGALRRLPCPEGWGDVGDLTLECFQKMVDVDVGDGATVPATFREAEAFFRKGLREEVRLREDAWLPCASDTSGPEAGPGSVVTRIQCERCVRGPCWRSERARMQGWFTWRQDTDAGPGAPWDPVVLYHPSPGEPLIEASPPHFEMGVAMGVQKKWRQSFKPLGVHKLHKGVRVTQANLGEMFRFLERMLHIPRASSATTGARFSALARSSATCPIASLNTLSHAASCLQPRCRAYPIVPPLLCQPPQPPPPRSASSAGNNGSAGSGSAGANNSSGSGTDGESGRSVPRQGGHGLGAPSSAPPTQPWSGSRSDEAAVPGQKGGGEGPAAAAVAAAVPPWSELSPTPPSMFARAPLHGVQGEQAGGLHRETDRRACGLEVDSAYDRAQPQHQQQQLQQPPLPLLPLAKGQSQSGLQRTYQQARLAQETVSHPLLQHLLVASSRGGEDPGLVFPLHSREAQQHRQQRQTLPRLQQQQQQQEAGMTDHKEAGKEEAGKEEAVAGPQAPLPQWDALQGLLLRGLMPALVPSTLPAPEQDAIQIIMRSVHGVDAYHAASAIMQHVSRTHSAVTAAIVQGDVATG